MKLIKQDKYYKYYELSEKNQDDSCYWDSDLVAISKDDLKYMSAKDCLMDGNVKPCDYECYERKSVFSDYVINPSTIIIVD